MSDASKSTGKKAPGVIAPVVNLKRARVKPIVPSNALNPFSKSA
ncbi:hypothetical protein B0G77_4309 [Paraburkholderia sp. BL10I2N1]|nr:hypothetical protein B0G77_4309 [Paraburkholderia sp. BL10I2N1]